MNGGQVTAIIIVAIVMFTGIVRARYGLHSRRLGRYGRDAALPARDDGELVRMREEMKAMKDRIAVLERITVEKENSLAREIEQLRDR